MRVQYSQITVFKCISYNFEDSPPKNKCIKCEEIPSC